MWSLKRHEETQRELAYELSSSLSIWERWYPMGRDSYRCRWWSYTGLCYMETNFKINLCARKIQELCLVGDRRLRLERWRNDLLCLMRCFWSVFETFYCLKDIWFSFLYIKVNILKNLLCNDIRSLSTNKIREYVRHITHSAWLECNQIHMQYWKTPDWTMCQLLHFFHFLYESYTDNLKTSLKYS
jgi:hypothetical protein